MNFDRNLKFAGGVEVNSGEDGKTIHIQTKYACHRLEIFGSSVPLSTVLREGVNQQSFDLFPEQNKVGVIALLVYTEGGKEPPSKITFLVQVTWKDGTPILAAGKDDKPWASSPERPCIFQEYPKKIFGIEIRMGNDRFTTAPNIPDTQHIPNSGDLLLRWALNEVDDQAVMDVAEEAQAEISELENHQKTMELLTNELRETTHSLEFWKDRALILKMAICWWLVDGTEGRWPFTWFRRWLTPYAVSQASESRFWQNKKDE